MNNQYFILRHGETTQQTKNKLFSYPSWLDAKPPIGLTKRGERLVRSAARILKKENIDLIYCSDIFRTRQTAKIVISVIGEKKLSFDKRLRDINLGVYHGRLKTEYHLKFPNPAVKFYKGPPKGESWGDLRKRLKIFLRDVEKRNKNKKILIVSHGDPLWMLEGIVKKMSNQELLDEIFKKHNYIKVADLRKLN